MKMKKLSLEEDILQVIKYFAFFNFCPDLKTIYSFLCQKTSKKAFKKAILSLEHKKRIKIIKDYCCLQKKDYKNTPPQYSINDQQRRKKISEKKLQNWKFQLYCRLLSLMPQIKLVGLSGTLSMMNAKEDDDIDLFIITSQNRLFTGRFLAVFLAKLMFIYRSREKTTDKKIKDKVCLNLFFDQSYLKVPKIKQTKFVAHEILQMRPIINKDQTYERFLKANQWVYKIFPNNKKYLVASQLLNNQAKKCLINLTDRLEKLFKKIQLYFINRHRTKEIILNKQLWFHPDDFEKKLPQFE